jgi:hypothetical protein
MHDTLFNSGWDTFLVAIPLLGLLLAGNLHLDEIVASPKRQGTKTKRFCGNDEDGQTIFSDPDGRRWPSQPQAR